MNRVLRHLHEAALLRDGGPLSDGQLLDCFVSRHDQAAFAALVRRHGPMVLGVCRRVLGNRHDAEDAFQAAFLVLVRKAASLRARELLGAFLYGVAYRTALKARVMATRRRVRERRAAVRAVSAAPAEEFGESLALLDQELSRLPEKYRAAVVLCELEGRSRREAAGMLKVPEGTVSSRLAAARKLLAARLARRGVAPAGMGLAALAAAGTTSACVPAALREGTTRAALLVAGGQAAAAGVVPAQVAALTEGVLRTMMLAKVKTATVVLLGATVLGLGSGSLAYRARAVADEPPGEQRVTPAREAAEREARQRAEAAERLAQEARAVSEEARARAEAERARAVDAMRKAEAVLAQREALEKQLQEAHRALEEFQAQVRPDQPRQRTPSVRQAGPGDDRDRGPVDLERALRELDQARDHLRRELAAVEAKREKLLSEYKARQDELRRDPRREPDRSPDKLEQILERLERMEKRLDRLERN
jgi:RNA polymerase sigma factor (sigma-70 family)